jgi:hypothetical protein
LPSLCLLVISCSELSEAAFSFTPANSEAGDTIYFQNLSENATSSQWDFGDGSSSSEEAPVHFYSLQGEYTITLTVSNEDGSDETSKSITILAPTGSVLSISISSPGLEGNMLGDDPDRHVTVYLPPGYALETKRHYPVIYFLHGFVQSHTTWFGEGSSVQVDFEDILDQLIGEGEIQPMILVSPNSHYGYDGSYYTNSTVTGNWEDFIVKDVVAFMDNNYRTLDSRESRGITGHSMGDTVP